MNEQRVFEEAFKLPLEAQQRLAQALQRNCAETDPKRKAAITKVLEERRKDYLEGRSTLHSREESMRMIRETIDAAIKQSHPN